MAHTLAACSNCHAINRITIEKIQTAICGKCQKSLTFHGLVSEASAQDFQKIIRLSDRPVIVDFWASWCGPCKMYGPEFEKASKSNPHAVFLKINTETEQDLSTSLGIRGIPCTILFKGGKEIKRQAGVMDAEGISSFLAAL